MDSGIYLLDFDKFGIYIGQSQNIPERYEQHIQAFRQGKASQKVQEARIKYGRTPKLKILCICHPDWLHKLEAYYINKFSKYTDGTILLNTSRPIVDEDIPASLLSDAHPHLSIKLSLLDNWRSLERLLKA